MTVYSDPYMIASDDAFRQLCGDPRQVELSQEGRDYVDAFVSKLHSWKRPQYQNYKKALGYSLGKQAEMYERAGIPLERGFGSTLRIKPISKKEPNKNPYHIERNDSVYLPRLEDIAKMIPLNDKDAMARLQRFLTSSNFHEFRHHDLVRAIGRPFQRKLQHKYQFDTVATPGQLGVEDRDSLREKGLWVDPQLGGHKSLIYRGPWERNAAFYGVGDYGHGYPSEFLSQTAGYLPLYGTIAKPALKMLRKMLQSMARKVSLDAKDEGNDLYQKQHYTIPEQHSISKNVLSAMTNLATTQSALRNQLALLQNQAMGVLALRSAKDTPAHNDLDKIKRNHGILGTAPLASTKYNQDDLREILRYPISREPDPVVYDLAEDTFINPVGYNIDQIWPVPPIAWRGDIEYDDEK